MSPFITGLSRRRLLAAAAGATLLAACAPIARRPAFTLVPASISPERVTAVLVGLRPYRAPGFVVRADELGAKRVVHNYGHGGAGVTLSWGTSQEAVDLGFDASVRDYAVIGCGVIGLTVATLLQQRGAAVTLYAKSLPPMTTSNIAGGHWSPYSVFEPRAASPGFMEQFHRVVRTSFRAFERLVGPRHTVSWRHNYTVHDGQVNIAPRTENLRDVLPELEILAPGEHPFGNAHVQHHVSLMVEPNRYLDVLMDDFRAGGGRIEVREFTAVEELVALPQRVIFNCTGLGARALFGDPDLVPARGQLVMLQPQPEVDYNLFANRSYIFPRSDGIVLGGTFDTGVWDLEPDAATTARILERSSRAMARISLTKAI